jgi:hypothetical protein
VANNRKKNYETVVTRHDIAESGIKHQKKP